MRDLPGGTVTLLFTDVAGSTRLLEELGDRYAEALAAHRERLRSAFARHGGVEVDTQGDAFFAAFTSAAEAVAAAVEARDALAEDGQFRVRIGIHTGEPMRTDEGYVGLDVHRAARIAAAGHGGQILVSRAVCELVGPAGLLDLGAHRLKDVGELRLYQVGDEAFPPLRSLSRSNLPAPPGPLVGRRRELEELTRALGGEGGRLVTVTGPGGVGKTRLALEAAAELLAAFADGATFVDLSPIRDPGLVEPSIAAAVGATGDLADHLREREQLLVLDNLEQVVGAAPRVASLLDACPRLAILATSREPLRLRAELEYPLAPLGEAPAVELFRERARAVSPGFDDDPERLDRLCERLERLPLAIELAAARVKILSPEQLLGRLERRLPVLTGGARDAPERQRTLRATIEWSHDLLDAEEQVLFARLAVFAGGWTPDAAEEVCDAGLDVLQSLVDKSLVRAEEGRHRMLETIREYASERLDASGEGDELRRRHAAHFAALAAAAEPELTGPEQHVWLDRLAADYDNLRVALAWHAEAEDGGEAGLALVASLALFWFIRGLVPDGLHWLERVLAASGAATAELSAQALWAAGFLHALAGDAPLAESYLGRSLALARAGGNESTAARSLNVLGLLAFFRNEMREMSSLLEEAAALARNAGDLWCLADTLGTLGSIYPLCGEAARAQAAGAEALAVARRAGDRQGIRMALFGLALAAARRGDLDAARELGGEGLAVSREIGDLWFVSYFLWVLATVSSAAGEPATARAQAEEALQVARELGVPLLLVCALDALAASVRAEGDAADAEALLLEARATGTDASPPVPDSYRASVLRGLAELAFARGDVAGGEALLTEALALARGVGDAWEVGRGLLARARVAARADPAAAAALVDEALTLLAGVQDRLGAAQARALSSALGRPGG